MTRAEYQAKYGQSPDGPGPHDDLAARETQIKNPLGKAVVAFGQAAKETNDALTGNSGTPLDYVNPLGWASKAFGGAVKAIGGVVDKVADYTTKPLGTFLGSKAREAVGGENVDKVVNSPGVQNVVKIGTELANDPAVKEGVGAVGNVADLGGTLAAVSGVGEGFGKLSESVKQLAQNLADNAAAGAKDRALASAQAGWEKPIDIPGHVKATDIATHAEDMGNHIPETLAKSGVGVDANVAPDGKTYATDETAAQMRADAGKASREMLRPSLQQADAGVPKTPVQAIVDRSIADIKTSKGMTPDDIEAQISNAQAKGEALARKYPDGMSLTDMHDEKINYNSNRYNPLGTRGDNNAAAADRSFGRSLGRTVEEKAPAGIPVKEFNAELQKQYQAADYLEALNGKRVPQSVLSKLANTIGKWTGARIGSSLGGGLLGGVAGYHIGGMVESLLEGIPREMRASVFNTLETSNPEAFNAIKDYMGAEKAAQATRLALPAPTEQTPIQLPGNPKAGLTPGYPNYNPPGMFPDGSK